jgi:hypothetical protein
VSVLIATKSIWDLRERLRRCIRVEFAVNMKTREEQYKTRVEKETDGLFKNPPDGIILDEGLSVHRLIVGSMDVGLKYNFVLELPIDYPWSPPFIEIFLPRGLPKPPFINEYGNVSFEWNIVSGIGLLLSTIRIDLSKYLARIFDTRARIIQRNCANWLYKPSCNDGTIGVVPRLFLRKLNENQH